MKTITILKKGATILHDAIVAHTPDGRPVFILPANLPAPQLDVHPQGMIVYSVPEQQFPPFVVDLLSSKERLRFPVRAPRHTLPGHSPEDDRPESPRSELVTHGLDLSSEDVSVRDVDEQQTG